MDQTQTARPGSPPRRLRACVPCTRAKARCNFREENTGRHVCDRCERLGVDCAAKTTKGVRKPRQLKPLMKCALLLGTARRGAVSATHRVASLEHQLATLVTRETGLVRAAASSAPLPTPSSSSSSSSGSSTAADPGSPQPHPWPVQQQQQQQQQRHGTGHDGPPPFGLTWSQAAFALDDFRNLFAPNFPFVTVDPRATPRRLLREKPFLFRAVVLVATPLPRSRAAEIHREILSHLGQRMLQEGEESLDLLQGLLVIIMWADIKYLHDEQITRLVYQALGFAHSLRLTKPPAHGPDSRTPSSSSSSPSQQQQQQQPDDCFSAKFPPSMTRRHTPEEQRALLGVVYAVTANSHHFGRRNPLARFAAAGGYVDACCDDLARSGDSAGDAVLVKTVKLMQLSVRIAELNEMCFPQQYGGGAGCVDGVLFEAQAAEIKRAADSIAAGLDPRDPLLSFLRMQYHSVLVDLHEPATRAATSTPLRRTACLLDCLSAARSYFDGLTALPAGRYLFRTSGLVSPAQTVVMITTRLLVLDVEGWDLASARVSFDFLAFSERVTRLCRDTVAAGAERMRRFAEETGTDVGSGSQGEARGGMCEELIEKMGWITNWYKARLQAEEGKVTGGHVVVNRDLMEEIMRFWHWGPDAAGMPFFGGLLNPLDVSYDGI
ncbi:hypothetical protein Cob_v012727 [Colletotrichum orbiculare MAFF 240422]|uniref:Uncharacterized protein n=1 Tax=Colletotrichum orbiculare (strain 104-T / ATCC 96160 / CBS 514.97 / LARS 414 / MAFF 240422) TaxID=1213857 RepID=N4VFN1_COLOR|nr:hypothetical protein Cob_v012727 [Colletotrichum orbiculare MAFF 240422]